MTNHDEEWTATDIVKPAHPPAEAAPAFKKKSTPLEAEEAELIRTNNNGSNDAALHQVRQRLDAARKLDAAGNEPIKEEAVKKAKVAKAVKATKAAKKAVAKKTKKAKKAKSEVNKIINGTKKAAAATGTTCGGFDRDAKIT